MSAALAALPAEVAGACVVDAIDRTDAAALAAVGADAALDRHLPSFLDPPSPVFAGIVTRRDATAETPAGVRRLKAAFHTFVPLAAPLPADAVGLFAFVRRKPGMTLEAFRRHSLTVHGPMDARMPGLLGYVQCHADDADAAGFDCVSVFRFADLAALQAALAAPGSAASAADLDAFVDLSSAVVLATRPAAGRALLF